MECKVEGGIEVIESHLPFHFNDLFKNNRDLAAPLNAAGFDTANKPAVVVPVPTILVFDFGDHLDLQPFGQDFCHLFGIGEQGFQGSLVGADGCVVREAGGMVDEFVERIRKPGVVEVSGRDDFSLCDTTLNHVAGINPEGTPNFDTQPWRPAIMVAPNTVVDGRTLPPETRRRGIRGILNTAVEKSLVVDIVAVLGQEQLFIEAKPAVADKLTVQPIQEDLLFRIGRLALGLFLRRHLPELDLGKDFIPDVPHLWEGHVWGEFLEVEVALGGFPAVALEAVLLQEGLSELLV